jgi:GNAT superfamily N-acetyltransferase
MHIALAETDAELRRCYPVMAQLRPHLEEEEFLDRVRRLRSGGYLLAFLEVHGTIRSVAGFRIQERLVRGLHLHVDDLVTDQAYRSQGYGDELFDWLLARAREAGCGHLELDSGVQRFAAHRFLFRREMHIGAFHFTMPVE